MVAANFDGGNPDAASANVNDVSVLINTNPWGVCEHTFIGGIVDDYVDPLPFTTEDACPSITLSTFIGPLPMRPFDGPPSCNRIFAHSFQNLPGNILAGELEIRRDRVRVGVLREGKRRTLTARLDDLEDPTVVDDHISPEPVTILFHGDDRAVADDEVDFMVHCG